MLYNHIMFIQAWKRARHYSTQIDRQRMLLDPNKIVLPEDFCRCFNQSASPTVLAGMQERYISEAPLFERFHLINVNKDKQASDRPFDAAAQKQFFETDPEPGGYFLDITPGPNSKLEIALRNYLLKHGGSVFVIPAPLLNSPEKEKKAGPFYDRILQEHKEAYAAFEANKSQENQIKLEAAQLKAHINDMLYPPVAAAMYLGEVIEAVDMSHPTGRFFDTAKFFSLLKGEGGIALKFWKAVNAIDDYSHLFPNVPQDGEKRRREQKTFTFEPGVAQT